MSTHGDRFLEVERIADQLLSTLEGLHSEAGSYKVAGEELSAVRERLAQFLELSEGIAQGTRQAVTTLAGIGGPEILAKLDVLRNATDRSEADLREAQARTGVALTRLEKVLGERFSQLDGRLQKVRQVALLAAIASAMALAVGILGVLR